MSLVSYQVRARYHDYETGAHTLKRTFDTIEEAEAFKSKINAHIAYADEEQAHPSLRSPVQGECESDGAFEMRNSAWTLRVEQHHEEELEWFDMGSGYFTGVPRVYKITEELV